jgi:dihydrofolate reductase
MSKIVLYIACSIDGFIARPDGRIDWLESIPNPDRTDHGYQNLLDNTSCIIMGRKTYTEVLGFGIEWPYADKLTYIVSREKSFQPETPNTKTLSGNIAETVRKMKAEPGKDIWLVGGGQLVTYFLNNDLVDRMIISIAPTIIGQGIPLFPGVPKETSWILSGHTAYSTGIISLTYDRK